MQCVHMPRVNMEGATFKGCTMDTMMGIHTNLEGILDIRPKTLV